MLCETPIDVFVCSMKLVPGNRRPRLWTNQTVSLGDAEMNAFVDHIETDANFIVTIDFCRSLHGMLSRWSTLADIILRSDVVLPGLCSVDISDEVLCSESISVIQHLLEIDERDQVPFDQIYEFACSLFTFHRKNWGIMISTLHVTNFLIQRSTVIPGDVVPNVIEIFQEYEIEADSEINSMFMLEEISDSHDHARFLLYLSVSDVFETYMSGIHTTECEDVVMDDLLNLCLSPCHEVSVQALRALITAAETHRDTFHSRFHICQAADQLAWRLEAFKRRENVEGVRMLLHVFSEITSLNTENENMTMIANRNVLPSVLARLMDVNAPEFFVPCCRIMTSFIRTIPGYASVLLSQEEIHTILSQYNPYMDVRSKLATGTLLSHIILAIPRSQAFQLTQYISIIVDFPDLLTAGSDKEFETFIRSMMRLVSFEINDPEFEQVRYQIACLDFDSMIASDSRKVSDACRRHCHKIQKYADIRREAGDH